MKYTDPLMITIYLLVNCLGFSAVGKKLSAAAKKKEYQDLALWAKGVKNHLYYSILSTDGKTFSGLIFSDAQIY
jgi:hypothetical protein